jgi:hypothetical protein
MEIDELGIWPVGAGPVGEGPGLPLRQSLKEMMAEPIQRNQEIQLKLQAGKMGCIQGTGRCTGSTATVTHSGSMTAQSMTICHQNAAKQPDLRAT